MEHEDLYPTTEYPLLDDMSHADFLRAQLRELNLSTGEIPEGCFLVGFDVRGYSAYCSRLSQEEIALFQEEIDRFAIDVAHQFGLLLTANPGGDSATFIAPPAFDEEAYRAFIAQVRLRNLSVRSAVQRVQSGTAQVNLLPDDTLALSGSALLSYLGELNGQAIRNVSFSSTERHSVLDVDPSVVRGAPLITRPRYARPRVVGETCLVVRLDDVVMTHAGALRRAVAAVLEGAPSGVRLGGADEGLLFIFPGDHRWRPNAPHVEVRVSTTATGSRVLDPEAPFALRALKGKPLAVAA